MNPAVCRMESGFVPVVSYSTRTPVSYRAFCRRQQVLSVLEQTPLLRPRLWWLSAFPDVIRECLIRPAVPQHHTIHDPQPGRLLSVWCLSLDPMHGLTGELRDSFDCPALLPQPLTPL
jgi:hypothetical protein